MQNLSKELKEKNRQCGHEQYKNLSVDEKQRLAKYRKKHYEISKNFMQ